MDSRIFSSWAEEFVEGVKEKTRNGRKVLLIYDGYKCHLGIKALDTLKNGNVIAYCLPAHTSGLLQPLDVALFGPFKAFLRDLIAEAARVHESMEFDQFDFLHMMTSAYVKAFTAPHIISAFKKSGAFPVDGSKICTKALPRSFEKSDELVAASALASMLTDKMRRADSGEKLQPVVLHRGHVCTKEGILATSEEVRDLVRGQQQLQAKKRIEKEVASVEKELEWEREKAEKREQREAFNRWALNNRVKKYNTPDVMPRTLQVRRTLARMRVLTKKGGMIGTNV